MTDTVKFPAGKAESNPDLSRTDKVEKMRAAFKKGFAAKMEERKKKEEEEKRAEKESKVTKMREAFRKGFETKMKEKE